MNYEKLEFDKIEKTKDLYFNTGSLRRYALRSEIANSWIRYNLFKSKKIKYIDKTDRKNISVKVYLKKLENEIEKMNFRIYLVVDDQNIITSLYDENEKFYSTGAEISNKIREDYTVFKNEHISDIFFNKFTHGINIKKDDKYFITIGIEGDMDYYSIDKINAIKKMTDEIYIDENNNDKNLEFLDYRKICENINLNMPVFIKGKSGVGKYSLVKYIWENYYNDYSLKVVNCSRIKNIEKYFNARNKTMLYFEKLELLEFSEQVKLVKILESKQVYNNNDKYCDSNNIFIIISMDDLIDNFKRNDLIKERLLTRLTTNSIILKPLIEYERKSVIEFFELNVNSIVSDNVIDFILELKWKNNFHDLKKLIEILNNKKTDAIIELNDLPRSLFAESFKITTLKEAEKNLIERTILEYEKNISLCAKSLGISRSTLYRKINEYQIVI